jgi:hypothetical protein
MAIPKDTSVGIFVHFLHRNPLVWTDPDKFDPERFMDEVILFNFFFTKACFKGDMAFSVKSFSITTLSIKSLFAILDINDIQHNDTQY